MYNEDRKQRFYEFKLKTVASVTPLVPRFKRVAPFEHMYQKDLCDFNLNEITEMYKLFKFTTLESIIVVNNTLTQYTDWCVNENLVLNGQNIYATITPDMLAALLNKTLLNHQIVSRDTILTWIEALKNPRDRFMILSIFEYGKSKDFEDTIRAKLDDIDVENHTMKLYSAGAHMFRHWFTMYLLTKARLTSGEIMKWRGDSSQESMNDYIHENADLIEIFRESSYTFQSQILEDIL